MLWQPRQSPHAWFNIQETSAGTLRQSWESQATQPGQYFPIAGFLWPFVCDLKSNISDNLIQHLVSEGCKLFKACLPSSLMSRCHIAWIFANIPHGVGNRTNPCELPGVLVLRLEFNICEQKSCWIWTVGFLEPTLKDANTRYQSLATPRRHVQDDPSSFHLGPEMSIFPQFMHLASVWAGSWWYVAVGNSHGFGPQKTGCCCGLWTARSHWPCLQAQKAQKAQIWQNKGTTCGAATFCKPSMPARMRPRIIACWAPGWFADMGRSKVQKQGEI